MPPTLPAVTAPATVSRRAAATIAYHYDDFPAGLSDVDLRGDNSPPLRTTVAVLERFTPTVQHTAGYGDVAGDQRLRALLGELFGMPAANVVVTVGGSEALQLALTCVTDHGDAIWLPRPTFPGHDQLAQLLGLRRRHYDVPGPLPERLDAAPLLVCTPHNPTGVTTATNMVDRRPGWTIWDVAHASLTGRDLYAIRGMLTATGIVVFSLSKLLRLPGLRVGCLVTADQALAATAAVVKTHLSMSVDQLAQHVAAQVLADPGTRPELADRARHIAGLRRRIVNAAAASRALTAFPAMDGTHVLLRARDGADAWRRLRGAGVIGLPGTVFNTGADTVRLCVAQPVDVIVEAANRLVQL